MAFAVKQKTVTVNKKRVGKHRKHSQKDLHHYCCMLWPQGAGVLGSHADLSSGALLSATNRDREQNNTADLTVNTELSQAAQSKALDMVAGNYWSHDTPDGATPWSFIEKSGYSYSKAGENLAYGFSDATTAMNAWMHSPEHRKNLLDPGYSEVGLKGEVFIAHHWMLDIVLVVLATVGFVLTRNSAFIL
jgi:uncharacterized protein YkwD